LLKLHGTPSRHVDWQTPLHILLIQMLRAPFLLFLTALDILKAVEGNSVYDALVGEGGGVALLDAGESHALPHETTGDGDPNSLVYWDERDELRDEEGDELRDELGPDEIHEYEPTKEDEEKCKKLKRGRAEKCSEYRACNRQALFCKGSASLAKETQCFDEKCYKEFQKSMSSVRASRSDCMWESLAIRSQAQISAAFDKCRHNASKGEKSAKKEYKHMCNKVESKKLPQASDCDDCTETKNACLAPLTAECETKQMKKRLR